MLTKFTVFTRTFTLLIKSNLVCYCTVEGFVTEGDTRHHSATAAKNQKASVKAYLATVNSKSVYLSILSFSCGVRVMSFDKASLPCVY